MAPDSSKGYIIGYGIGSAGLKHGGSVVGSPAYKNIALLSVIGQCNGIAIINFVLSKSGNGVGAVHKGCSIGLSCRSFAKHKDMVATCHINNNTQVVGVVFISCIC